MTSLQPDPVHTAAVAAAEQILTDGYDVGQLYDVAHVVQSSAGTDHLDSEIGAAILARLREAFIDIVPQIIATAARDYLAARGIDERIRAFFADDRESFPIADVCEFFGIENRPSAWEDFLDVVIVRQENPDRVPRGEAHHGAALRWGWRALTRALGDDFVKYFPARRAIRATLVNVPQFVVDEWSYTLNTEKHSAREPITSAIESPADILGEAALARWEESGIDDEFNARMEAQVPGWTAAARYSGGAQ